MELGKRYTFEDLLKTIDVLELKLSESQEGNRLAGAALEAGAVAVSDLLDENDTLREEKEAQCTLIEQYITDTDELTQTNSYRLGLIGELQTEKDNQAKTIKAFRSDIEDLTSVVSERDSQLDNQAKTIIRQIGLIDNLQVRSDKQMGIIEKRCQLHDKLTACNDRQKVIIERLEHELGEYCVQIKAQRDLNRELSVELATTQARYIQDGSIMNNQTDKIHSLQQELTRGSRNATIKEQAETIQNQTKELSRLNRKIADTDTAWVQFNKRGDTFKKQAQTIDNQRLELTSLQNVIERHAKKAIENYNEICALNEQLSTVRLIISTGIRDTAKRLGMKL